MKMAIFELAGGDTIAIWPDKVGVLQGEHSNSTRLFEYGEDDRYWHLNQPPKEVVAYLEECFHWTHTSK
jgi:hypothetical protein